MQEGERPARFERVLNEEIDLVAAARSALGVSVGDAAPAAGDDSVYARAHRASLCGLAFSGGGIRSATFNLGVLQALCKHRLLGRFDYLSTVSGGGYIGAWLGAWIHRHPDGVLGVQTAIREGLAGRGLEPTQIGWLRDYSNYLAVRLGVFSGDGWASVAIYLRNLCLNLTLIIACLGIAVLAPRVLIFGLQHLPAHWFHGLGLGMLALAVMFIALNLHQGESRLPWVREHFAVMTFILAPGWIAALMFAHALMVDLPGAAYVRSLLGEILPASIPLYRDSWILAGAILYSVPWIMGASMSKALPFANESPRFRWTYVLAFAPLSGALLGALCYGYSVVALKIVNAHPIAGVWLITGFGTAALAMIFSLVLVLHIGLVSRGFAEDVREWWGRLGGWATLATVVWVLGFGLVIYTPALVAWTGEWIAAAGAGWILSTLAGVWLGRNAQTGTRDPGRLVEWITTLLPFVFVTGMVIAIAVGMHALLVPAVADCIVPTLSTVAGEQVRAPLAMQVEAGYCELALAHPYQLWRWLLGLGLLAFILQLRVDVNVFSLGPLYRNRLLRCYLGASRQAMRRPHPFTGFDRDDDLKLSALAGPVSDEGPARPHRPYPVINAAINLTAGQKLAWQSRKAASFAFTPLYCGYQMPEEGGSRWIGRYCATRDYVSGPKRAHLRGSIALSNAVSISGAAASPNAGYHTSPLVAFLLTVFNVRLGSWFQNPRRPELWRRPGPTHSLKPLLSELFGLANDRSDLVYLSDGGHFENLGIYELVRRRCRFIIACDCSCDPGSNFEDLGNAIRKCRIDLDVDIEIDTNALVPIGDSLVSAHHCALGIVRYDRADPRERVGYLLYVKASMSGDEPQDVKQYRMQHPDFPHQSTSDQFFDEPQFESYRRLGLHVMDTVLAGPIAKARSAAQDGAQGRSVARVRDELEIDLESLFKELRQRWYPPLAIPAGLLARHSATLDAIYERIRADERLRFLDPQLNPDWPQLEAAVGAQSREQPWLPDDVHALRAAFYLCGAIIQLMENVYLDLKLEEHHDHPDNRGWMNLFRAFSAAGMVRVTWAITAATFGARFQSFCERRFRLGESWIELDAPITVAQILADRDNAKLRSSQLNAIAALKRADELAETDTVIRFKLSVRHAPSATDRQSSFGYPVAFAALRQDPQAPHRWRLRFFRVADHLQRMGMGWRATLALLVHLPELELDLATRAPELRTAASEADRVRYVRMFRAAKRVASQT